MASGPASRRCVRSLSGGAHDEPARRVAAPDDLQHAADAELDGIAGELRSHPKVLELRWQIYATSKKWHACVDIAKALIALKPNRALGWIHHAYALHELKRTQEAFEVLALLASKFPKDSTIPYNPACYTGQLGRFNEAGRWLEKAYEIGNVKEIKLRALDDPDLAPLWQDGN